MTFDPTYLAVGGLMAACAAGWQQVKNAFGYISSFVLVQAHIHDPVAGPVWSHLRRHWTLLPSGLLTYVGIFMHIPAFSTYVPVPFRIPANQNTIWRRGWRFVAASYSSGEIKITALRGFADIDNLVAEACRQWGPLAAAEPEGNHFSVYRIKGREKFGGSQTGGRGGVSPESTSPSPSLPSSWMPPIDMQIDRSVAWSPEEYSNTNIGNEPLRSLWFDPAVLRHLDDAKRWRSMGEWFRARDIPWRRGWLLHGPGGTGKSSLAKALAQTLNVPIYQYFLATMSDQEFLGEWDDMRVPCVALFEDFDTVFEGRAPLTEHKSLTFDCILNAISGVSSPPGVFLVVTTNKINSIDPAMGVATTNDSVSTRPGRIDAVIELGPMTAQNRRHMAARTLRDWPDTQDRVVADGDGMTAAQFQELCVRSAFESLAEIGRASQQTLRLVS